jgi:F0F1-type ATP synthase membrane subunit b/b'
LHEEAADLAVELAGSLLAEQVTDADRERLVTEFIERIERSDAESGR